MNSAQLSVFSSGHLALLIVADMPCTVQAQLGTFLEQRRHMEPRHSFPTACEFCDAYSLTQPQTGAPVVLMLGSVAAGAT